MSASTPPPPPQWPLRPNTPRPSRDWAAEFLALRRTPARGNITGLSAALADWLGIDVLLMRCLFVLTGLCSGIGVIAYFTGWMLTRNSQTGLAPLDHIGRHWRSASPGVIANWALAFGIIGSLLVGTVMGLGWLPVAVLGLTIWAGHRARSNGHLGGRPRQPKRNIRYWTPTAALPPNAVPAKQIDGAAIAITIITLGLAAGTGFFLLIHSSTVVAMAVALAMIGLGLLVIARRSSGLGLIIPGAALAVLLTGATIMPPAQPITGSMTYLDEPAQLSDTWLFSEQQTMDITTVVITEDETWQVDLDDSQLSLTIPADQNIIVDVSYNESLVSLPNDFYSGSGQAGIQQIVDDSLPTLTIEISAHQSQLWVETP